MVRVEFAASLRHLVCRHGLVVGNDGQTLAMASTTSGLWVSANAGEGWHDVLRDLPPVAAPEFVAGSKQTRLVPERLVPERPAVAIF